MPEKRVTRNTPAGEITLPSFPDDIMKIELDPLPLWSPGNVGGPAGVPGSTPASSSFVPPPPFVNVFEKVRQTLVKELRENWRLFVEERRIVLEFVEDAGLKAEYAWNEEDAAEQKKRMEEDERRMRKEIDSAWPWSGLTDAANGDTFSMPPDDLADDVAALEEAETDGADAASPVKTPVKTTSAKRGRGRPSTKKPTSASSAPATKSPLSGTKPKKKLAQKTISRKPGRPRKTDKPPGDKTPNDDDPVPAAADDDDDDAAVADDDTHVGEVDDDDDEISPAKKSKSADGDDEDVDKDYVPESESPKKRKAEKKKEKRRRKGVTIEIPPPKRVAVATKKTVISAITGMPETIECHEDADDETRQFCFSCPACQKTFDHETKYRSHYSKVHDENSRTQLQRAGIDARCCDICGKHVVSNTALAQHIKFKHRKPPIACLYCPKMFFRRHDMEKHARFRHKEPDRLPWEQEQERRRDVVAAALALAQTDKGVVAYGRENESISSASAVAALLESDALTRVTGADDVPVEAEETVTTSDDPFFPKPKLTAYERKKLNEKRKGAIPCPACLKLFFTVANLKGHIVKYHPDLDPDAQKGIFDLKVIRDGRMFQCVECGKQFKDRQVIKTHVESVHMGMRYECDICGKSFSQESGVRAHKKVIHEKKRSVCSLCGYSGYSMSQLRRHHEAVHEKRKYECDLCGKTYSKRGMKWHKQRHHDQKTYPCDICGKELTALEFLRDHIASIHEGRRFCCDFCDNNFSQLRALKKHRSEAHGADGPFEPRETRVKVDDDRYKASIPPIVRKAKPVYVDADGNVRNKREVDSEESSDDDDDDSEEDDSDDMDDHRPIVRRNNVVKRKPPVVSKNVKRKPSAATVSPTKTKTQAKTPTQTKKPAQSKTQTQFKTQTQTPAVPAKVEPPPVTTISSSHAVLDLGEIHEAAFDMHNERDLKRVISSSNYGVGVGVPPMTSVSRPNNAANVVTIRDGKIISGGNHFGPGFSAAMTTTTTTTPPPTRPAPSLNPVFMAQVTNVRGDVVIDGNRVNVNQGIPIAKQDPGTGTAAMLEDGGVGMLYYDSNGMPFIVVNPAKTL